MKIARTITSIALVVACGAAATPAYASAEVKAPTSSVVPSQVVNSATGGAETSASEGDETGSTPTQIELVVPAASDVYDSTETVGAFAEVNADGTVDVRQPGGRLVATATPLQASNVAGVPAPTRFEVSGTGSAVTIHSFGTTPGSARTVWLPTVVKVARCAAAITWVVGTTVLAAGKLAAIVKEIKALGGVVEAAKLLIKASTPAEKRAALGHAGSAAGAFLGLDIVKDNC